LSFPFLKLLSWYMSGSLPLSNCPLGHLPLRYCCSMSQESLTCYCSMFAGPQSSPVSSQGHPLKILPGRNTLRHKEQCNRFLLNASLQHKRNHCCIKFLHWI
jgi:hypothetical protein